MRRSSSSKSYSETTPRFNQQPEVAATSTNPVAIPQKISLNDLNRIQKKQLVQNNYGRQIHSSHTRLKSEEKKESPRIVTAKKRSLTFQSSGLNLKKEQPSERINTESSIVRNKIHESGSQTVSPPPSASPMQSWFSYKFTNELVRIPTRPVNFKNWINRRKQEEDHSTHNIVYSQTAPNERNVLPILAETFPTAALIQQTDQRNKSTLQLEQRNNSNKKNPYTSLLKESIEKSHLPFTKLKSSQIISSVNLITKKSPMKDDPRSNTRNPHTMKQKSETPTASEIEPSASKLKLITEQILAKESEKYMTSHASCSATRFDSKLAESIIRDSIQNARQKLLGFNKKLRSIQENAQRAFDEHHRAQKALKNTSRSFSVGKISQNS